MENLNEYLDEFLKDDQIIQIEKPGHISPYIGTWENIKVLIEIQPELAYIIYRYGIILPENHKELNLIQLKTVRSLVDNEYPKI
jgi:hypothetical protein